MKRPLASGICRASHVMAGPNSSQLIMQTLRRVAGVASFDKGSCPATLYAHRAIYQGLAVLAGAFAASSWWAFVDPEGRIRPSPPVAGP